MHESAVTVDQGLRFESTYRQHGAHLWRSVLLYSGDPEVSSDAVAEVTPSSCTHGRMRRRLERILDALERCDDPSVSELTPLMDADGKNVVGLSSIQAYRPIWSPDASKISVEGADGVYVVDVGNGDVRHVSGAGTGLVSWSPDGSVLAIFDTGDIVVMKADGKDRIRITDTDTQETNPIWQPSG
jgi:hypothetical protein